ncbi:MAG: TonB family protein [Sphingomonadales bacterium]|nr:TonB family protein [Sphingomonadales bacterium]
MTDLSVSRSGYSNRRSPGAFAAAAVLNGGAIALLIAIPAAIVTPAGDPPLRIRFIDLAPPPPPVNDPPTTEPSKVDVPKATPRPADPVPTAADSIVDLTRDLPFTGTVTPPSFPGAGDVLPPVRPEPVTVRARPDPRFADAFRPDYPPAMRRDGLEGNVTVRVTIDARGRVTAIELVSASNPIFFEETRRQALRSWRFVPATRDGVAIESSQTMTVRFQLER